MRTGLSSATLAALLVFSSTGQASPASADQSSRRGEDRRCHHRRLDVGERRPDQGALRADYRRFDMMTAPLSTDRATWDRLQDGLAAARFDHSVRKARTIQVLDTGTFVVSGVWNITSSGTPAYTLTARCTDVYHRIGTKWPIVTEHCSVAPKE